MFKKKSRIVIHTYVFIYWILCFYQDTLMYKDRVRIAENMIPFLLNFPVCKIKEREISKKEINLQYSTLHSIMIFTMFIFVSCFIWCILNSEY